MRIKDISNTVHMKYLQGKSWYGEGNKNIGVGLSEPFPAAPNAQERRFVDETRRARPPGRSRSGASPGREERPLEGGGGDIYKVFSVRLEGVRGQERRPASLLISLPQLPGADTRGRRPIACTPVQPAYQARPLHCSRCPALHFQGNRSPLHSLPTRPCVAANGGPSAPSGGGTRKSFGSRGGPGGISIYPQPARLIKRSLAHWLPLVANPEVGYCRHWTHRLCAVTVSRSFGSQRLYLRCKERLCPGIYISVNYLSFCLRKTDMRLL
ncbi:uncharacterized protein LOC144577913 [Callithrix jacchus]